MRTTWMAGQYGLMVHWLAPGPPPEQGPYLDDLNAAVDRFDVARFLAEFDRSGAAWLIFTIGQNTLYSDPALSGFLRQCLGVGGAVTLNVGVFQEGHLGAETLKQLERLHLHAQQSRPRAASACPTF